MLHVYKLLNCEDHTLLFVGVYFNNPVDQETIISAFCSVCISDNEH